VTPARLVTGLITERGCCRATEKAILALFPEAGPTTKTAYHFKRHRSDSD
jgi:hypothetical protein